MTEQDEPQVLAHEADGIQEFDNDLPRWWVILFHASIVFSVFYLLYYHVLDIGDSSHERFEREAQQAALALERQNMLAGAESPTAVDPSASEEVLATGTALFTTHCVVCHREQGQGLVGPNLTDDYWIHGPTFADSLRTITQGVPMKGMISWRTVLRPNEIYAVASYIYTLRGTEPPDPKGPEGNQYEPEPPPAAPETEEVDDELTDDNV